jgi:predicted polyphosphate/ATP-dependent NAD kinase
MRLGLIVNPIAGMGGSVGLHGTDGETYRQAAALGATPIAHRRAGRAVKLLAKSIPDLPVITGSGTMGEKTAREAGLSPVVVPVRSDPTTSADTRAVAARMLDEGVGLIAFAGGDGTARDIVGVVGTEIPVVGIPTGVKMHSAVFGNTPEAAGAMASRYLAAPDQVPLTRREVLDAGDDPGHVAGFSVASVPFVRDLLQPGKATTALGDDASLDRLCGKLAEEMAPDHLYVLGPGTTVARILDHLGLEGTLAGVDVVRNRRMVTTNVTAAELVALLEPGVPATIYLGVIGGQGFLLGRGNQQISPEVISRVGEENVMILAGEEKVRLLDPPVLRVDTGVGVARPVMLGYRRVHTSPGRSTVMKVVT